MNRNYKGPHTKNAERLHVSVNPLAGVWPPSCATPSSSSCLAATSNTASHDSHEKISLWVYFFFPIWVRGSTWRPFGPPELRYDLTIESLSTDVFEPRTSTGSLCLAFSTFSCPTTELQSSHLSIYSLTFSTKRE